MKYINNIRGALSAEGFPVFSISDIRVMLSSQGAKKEYAYTLLHNLIARKEVIRITRGAYTFHKEIRVVGFAFSPFYYGLEDALSIRGIWEQGANPIIITRRKIRNGVRKFIGRNYVLHKIDKKHFFGHELFKIGGIWVPVSDIEKTFIDLVYFRHYIRDDVLDYMRRNVKVEKLNGYLKTYDERFSAKVLRLISGLGPDGKSPTSRTNKA